MDSPPRNYLKIPRSRGILESILKPSKFTALLGAILILSLGVVCLGISALNSANSQQILVLGAIVGFLSTILTQLLGMLRNDEKSRDIENQIEKTRHDQKSDVSALMLKQDEIEQKVDHIYSSVNGNLNAGMNRAWERVKAMAHSMRYTMVDCDKIRDEFDKALKEELASIDPGVAAATKPPPETQG